MTKPTLSPTITREPAKILAQIIQDEMEIIPGNVVLADEKHDIPPNLVGLFVIISDMGGTPIGNSNRTECKGNELEEIQEYTMRHVLQVDIFSFDGSARARKEEIAMALASIKSQQLMGKHLVSIARMPGPFINTSSLEVTAHLKRYTTEVAMTALHRKTKPALFYDKFRTVEVTTND